MTSSLVGSMVGPGGIPTTGVMRRPIIEDMRQTTEAVEVVLLAIDKHKSFP
ncbi:MAG: hypothetical protein WCK03_00935 [Candidatus Taylorbacteria bacterium]